MQPKPADATLHSRPGTTVRYVQDTEYQVRRLRSYERGPCRTGQPPGHSRVNLIWVDGWSSRLVRSHLNRPRFATKAPCYSRGRNGSPSHSFRWFLSGSQWHLNVERSCGVRQHPGFPAPFTRSSSSSSAEREACRSRGALEGQMDAQMPPRAMRPNGSPGPPHTHEPPSSQPVHACLSQPSTRQAGKMESIVHLCNDSRFAFLGQGSKAPYDAHLDDTVRFHPRKGPLSPACTRARKHLYTAPCRAVFHVMIVASSPSLEEIGAEFSSQTFKLVTKESDQTWSVCYHPWLLVSYTCLQRTAFPLLVHSAFPRSRARASSMSSSHAYQSPHGSLCRPSTKLLNVTARPGRKPPDHQHCTFWHPLIRTCRDLLWKVPPVEPLG